MASWTASRQNTVSRVFDTLKDSSLRVYQSNDHSQIDKPPGHRYIGDIHGPDLIGPIYAHRAQQIGIDPVTGGPGRGIGLGVQGVNAHLAHQGPYMPATDPDTPQKQ